MKIIIANSIGVDRNGRYIIHSPSRWSQSVSSKHNWFCYYPWELCYLSTLLKSKTSHNVKFLDGCLGKLNREAYTELISLESPDLLVIESGSRMIDENLKMALEIKRRHNSKIIFVGHHASVFSEELISKGVDYVCIGEYEATVLDIVNGVSNKKDIAGLYPNQTRNLLDVNNLPWPEDEDVRRVDYSSPGEPSSEYKEIQMYASRGCPNNCTFCVARNVYYRKPNWRKRNVVDVVNEIAYLKKKYPQIEGIFFDEEEHNVEHEFNISLSNEIIARGLNNLKYEAMCNIRHISRDVVTSMKRAGYYKLRLGLETESSLVGECVHKNINPKLIYSNLEIIKNSGLKTHGTMMVGMPGSTKESDNSSILFIKNLIKDGLLDNLQISVCTPQPGTPFYDEARKKNWIITDDMSMFDGGGVAVVSYPGYSNIQIEKSYRSAFLERDHAFFVRNFKNGRILFNWSFGIFKKHGFLGFIVKLFRRLHREFLWRVERKSTI